MWYHLGYFTRFTRDQAVATIDRLGQELAVKRGVTLHGFVLDDEWDDPAKPWNFNGIWRSGDDHSFAGIGAWRQRWITCRDADTYAERGGPGGRRL